MVKLLFTNGVGMETTKDRLRTISEMADNFYFEAYEDCDVIDFTGTPVVTRSAFVLIQEWCCMHAEDDMSPRTDAEVLQMRIEFNRKGEIQDKRDREFASRVQGTPGQDHKELMETLMLAANYLAIPRLLQVCFQMYAQIIKSDLKLSVSGVIRARWDLPDDGPAEQQTVADTEVVTTTTTEVVATIEVVTTEVVSTTEVVTTEVA